MLGVGILSFVKKWPIVSAISEYVGLLTISSFLLFMGHALRGHRVQFVPSFVQSEEKDFMAHSPTPFSDYGGSEVTV